MLVNTKRLQAKMDQEGLDGLVAASAENLFYFTGIQSVGLGMFPRSSQAYAIITRDAPTQPFFVGSVGELDQTLDAFPGLSGAIGYGKFFRETLEGATLSDKEQFLRRISVETSPAASALDALVSALEQMRLADKKIGIDQEGLLPGLYDKLAERVKANLVPVSETLHWVRMVKTDEEIRRLRRAANITERALIACKGVMRPGITEYDVAREFESSIVSQGGKPKFTFVRFGRNGISGQVAPGDTPLKQGDTIWFDVGCLYQGYWSDLARIFSLGEPGRRMKAFYRAMLAGEDAGIASARAGMTASELFDLVVKAVREAGVAHYRRHHVGHGIGVDVYDPPLLAPGVSIPFEEGMAINIETPYYEFGFGAVHVEDPFVIRSQGNVLLTDLSRELAVVE